MTRIGLAFLEPSASAPPYDRRDAVADAVRRALLEAGLGRRDPTVPLGDAIRPGATVLLKPNWVVHRNYADRGMDCLVTHPAVIAAAVREVAKARPARIIVGDAPIQGCDWHALVAGPVEEELRRAAGTCPLELVDFRRTILSQGELVEGVLTEQRDASRYVLFDLGVESLLEPISRPEGRFRVTWYDPDKLVETHRPGRHQYLLCREAFEADVILNLPKLKTHRKAGITGALKNLVGMNGTKDYLPHHRVGGSGFGGDCYPGYAPLKRIAEVFLDSANRRIGSLGNRVWSNRAYRLIGIHARLAGDPEAEGGWYGNDTVWRMSLDLNRIALYGRADGTLADAPQRRIWSLTDAIVCGEGEGPLSPEPRALGAVTFGGSSPAAEAVHAALLGLDPSRIAITREAFGRFRWPLAGSDETLEGVAAFCEGERLSLAQVAARGISVRPPKGWAGHCEWVREGRAA